MYSDGAEEPISSGYTASPAAFDAAGSKTVTVTYQGLTAAFTVTVASPSVSGLADYKLVVNGYHYYSVATVPSGAAVSWSSSNSSVVSVDANGRIYGNKPGSAVITASISVQGKTYSTSASVTVPSQSITLSSYSGSSTVNMDKDKIHFYDVNDVLRVGWKVTGLPEIYYNSGTFLTGDTDGSISVYTEWEVVSGAGSVGPIYGGSRYFYMYGPGTVTLRAVVVVNGYRFTGPNYTYTLNMIADSAPIGNYIRKDHSKSAANLGSVPKGKSVTVQQVYVDGPIVTGTQAWAYVTYGGVSGWIAVFYYT